MIFTETKIKNLYIINLKSFNDERGCFTRIFCKEELRKIYHTKEIVQINLSKTKKKGSIRGMHFQYPPKSEIKMVRCIKGSVYDVAVDLRKVSKTFLKWHGEILSSDNLKMIYIPEGFAHGFQTLEENSELLYLHTEFYSPNYEEGVNCNDPKFKIKWPLNITQISEKDNNYKYLDNNFRGLEL
ncbi:MAG: dTDP-4-dehydrorhamnose 3,5-epimerase [Candidatus Lokiarchaeota archaeon]|nr:dTDP-4-dehydrorhamnose 3,5-epimerase [Candidatus Lokiarchaeota archaeon]